MIASQDKVEGGERGGREVRQLDRALRPSRAAGVQLQDGVRAFLHRPHLTRRRERPRADEAERVVRRAPAQDRVDRAQVDLVAQMPELEFARFVTL